MLVSSELQLEGARIVREIGRITAASGWHGAKSSVPETHRSNALDALIQTAKDFEADAIIGINYVVDAAKAVDLSAVPVERIAASGIAVKLARV